MDTDRHGYCEHNRRDHKCWECQSQRARAAEPRVAELEGERNRALGVASGHMRKDASGIIGTVSELLRERNKAESRAEELQAQLDRATEPRAVVGELGERVSEMRRLHMIVNEGGTERLMDIEQAINHVDDYIKPRPNPDDDNIEAVHVLLNEVKRLRAQPRPDEEMRKELGDLIGKFAGHTHGLYDPGESSDGLVDELIDSGHLLKVTVVVGYKLSDSGAAVASRMGWVKP